MATAPSITKHIHYRLGHRGTSYVLILGTTIVTVYLVVDVDRHMPIISAKIGHHKLHDVLLDGGFDIIVIKDTK